VSTTLRLHRTSPRLSSLLSVPKHRPHRVPPPLVIPHRHPTVSVPPPPPLATGEAHRHSLPLIPQSRRGSMHGGAVPTVLRRAATEALSMVHRGPVPPAVHRTVDSVHGIFRCRLNLGIPLFLPLCKKAPILLEYQPALHQFS
jgi:hypothetical protein